MFFNLCYIILVKPTLKEVYLRWGLENIINNLQMYFQHLSNNLKELSIQKGGAGLFYPVKALNKWKDN